MSRDPMINNLKDTHYPCLAVITINHVVKAVRSQKFLSKVCIEEKVPGKRGRGRPPTRWLDNIKKWTGIPIDQLNIATQDRGVWKDIKAMLVHKCAAGGDNE